MRMSNMMWKKLVGSLVACLLFVTGCESVGTGSLTVLLETEDVIVDGLVPGDEVENIKDGWTVEFNKYLVTIGDIDVHFSTDEEMEAEAAEVFVVDMTQVPTGGLSLWSFENLAEGRWEFNYKTPGAADGSTQHESVEEADYDEMVVNDWTYLIDGVLTKSDGQSCPPADLATPGDKIANGNTSGSDACYDAPSVRFVFGVSAETRFGPCEADGVPGVAITADITQTLTATLHGDHLFFNGFPEGDEGGVMRLAQWVADCDLNLDGTVTNDELKAIAPSQLAVFDERYQLGGSPITPLEDMYVYLGAQLKTQGHFQGEGECPVDGVEHDHGHDHDH